VKLGSRLRGERGRQHVWQPDRGGPNGRLRHADALRGALPPLCELRAIRRHRLLGFGMGGDTYGWNIEMQMRAEREACASWRFRFPIAAAEAAPPRSRQAVRQTSRQRLASSLPFFSRARLNSRGGARHDTEPTPNWKRPCTRPAATSLSRAHERPPPDCHDRSRRAVGFSRGHDAGGRAKTELESAGARRSASSTDGEIAISAARSLPPRAARMACYTTRMCDGPREASLRDHRPRGRGSFRAVA